MAGHSFGAATTQAVAGQTFGRNRSMAEPRIKAAIAFSPSPPQRGSDADAFGKIAIPLLFVTGTLDAGPGDLTRTTPADRLRPFAAVPPGEKYLVVFEGGDHQVFGGRGIRRPARPEDARIIAATSELTTKFWKRTLLGRTSVELVAPPTTSGRRDLFQRK